MNWAEFFEAILNFIKQILGVKMEKPIPDFDYPLFKMTWVDLQANLASKGIICMIPDDPPDAIVYYTDEESLAKMVPYLVYPANLYIAERKDCDDYLDWAAADASKIWGIRIIKVFGDINNIQARGYHAFPMAILGPGEYKLWEPNAGFTYAGKLFDIGKHGYIPKKWK